MSATESRKCGATGRGARSESRILSLECQANLDRAAGSQRFQGVLNERSKRHRQVRWIGRHQPRSGGGAERKRVPCSLACSCISPTTALASFAKSTDSGLSVGGRAKSMRSAIIS